MSKNNLLLVCSVTLSLYAECAKEAFRGAVRNWPIHVGAIGAFFVFQFIGGLFGGMGMAGGFLVGLVEIALLSLYLSWISDTIQRERVNWRSLLHFDHSLFFSVIGVAFILWIARMLIHPFLEASGAHWAWLLIQLGLVIVFNAIPEVIYIRRYDSIPALGYAATFTRENWIEWFIPLLVLMSPLLVIVPQYGLLVLAQGNELLPALTITEIVLSAANFYGSESLRYIAILLAVPLANWYMFFRGHLFQHLESGSRRQRIFQARQS